MSFHKKVSVYSHLTCITTKWFITACSDKWGFLVGMTSHSQKEGLSKVRVNKQSFIYSIHHTETFCWTAEVNKQLCIFDTASENSKSTAQVSRRHERENNRMRPLSADVTAARNVKTLFETSSRRGNHQQVCNVQLKKSNFDFILLAAIQDTNV